MLFSGHVFAEGRVAEPFSTSAATATAGNATAVTPAERVLGWFSDVRPLGAISVRSLPGSATVSASEPIGIGAVGSA